VGGSVGAVTVRLHHSMVKLPESLMHPRRYDDRVGFFTETFEEYGNIKSHQVEDVQYITRWRLEKKDSSADVSEPKKPIVFYIGREVPEKWRSWVKKGVEAWQGAFEKAGFKNAILAKDAPTPQEDPDWDAEDARYSSIRWLPAKVENAMGPHVHDPRTGEILESDILMYHNVLKLVRDWYFVQASPNDTRAQGLPLPDDLIGELIAYVVSHEVGHTLGFPHNMKASSSYTVDQLRNPVFTKENGVEASIMDYGRFNYVAQPGDGARLIPIIGPYDRFAVEWGYREFKGAKTYEDEKTELDKIVARQLKDATLRFGDPNPAEDPSQQTEDLGPDP
ncbi:zinc-dependent metalloprotease, partial [Singulisphaera rosea]